MFACVSKYAYLQCDPVCFALYVNVCVCVCLRLCVRVFIYAPWRCIHFLLGGEEQMNKHRVKEDRPGGFFVFVCARESER